MATISIEDLETKSIQELADIHNLSPRQIYNIRCKNKVKNIYDKNREENNKDGLRRCNKCKEWNPFETYRKHPKGAHGRLTICNRCELLKKRISHLQRMYGFSPEEAKIISAKCAANRCEICRNPPTGKILHVDHDHKTGKFRGLLCSNCNTGIGLLKDDPDLLIRAAAYLKNSVSD